MKQLNLFIHKNKLLSENQYRFRETRTTAYAVMQMVEEMANVNENDECSIGLYVDPQKAFDTIDHRQLLKKITDVWDTRDCSFLVGKLFG